MHDEDLSNSNYFELSSNQIIITFQDDCIKEREMFSTRETTGVGIPKHRKLIGSYYIVVPFHWTAIENRGFFSSCLSMVVPTCTYSIRTTYTYNTYILYCVDTLAYVTLTLKR